MNRASFRLLAATVVSASLASVALGQGFDDLLKEIGNAPAPAPAAGGAAQPAAPEAAPAAPAEKPAEKAPVNSTGPVEDSLRAPKVDNKAALAAPDDKTVAEATLFVQQQEILRQAKEVEARKSLDKGTKALRAGEFDNAIKNLEEARRNMPQRPATMDLVAAARTALAQAYTQKADALVELSRKKQPAEALKDLEAANDLAKKALEESPGSPEAQAVVNRVSANRTRIEYELTIRKPVSQRKEIVDKRKSIQDLLIEGRDYFKNKELDSAEAAFAEVLKKDEYNTEAMRFLRKIGEIRYERHTLARETTEARMVDAIRDTWNPPIQTDVKVPRDNGMVTNVTDTTVLMNKLKSWIIPEINFRAANINDVIQFLVEASQQVDPDKIGVNIILNLNIPGAPAANGATDTAAPDVGALLGAPGEGAIPGLAPAAPAAGGGAAANVPSITLALRRTSLINAIKYITEVAGLRYRLEDNAVIITPVNVVSGTVITRLYPVQPSILDVITKKAEEDAANGGRGGRGGGGGGGGGEFIGMDGGNTTFQRTDERQFFESMGVPFPAGTSVKFNPLISKLIVANTPENLEKLEIILAALNLTASQVEIEARFVEINQQDLKELGLEWIFTDNWEIAMNKGYGGPMSSTEQVQLKADSSGVTKGMNFFHFDPTSGTIVPASSVNRGTGVNPLGGIMTFASVLTNPELQVVLHALDQHGAADLLSAPRVTTRSGVNAQIQVVREIIYPTEFESTQPQFQTGSSLGGSQVVTPPLITPGSFETREVGVILNVTPTVGPDGFTIDLTLAPEVSELESWINYGSSFGDFTFNIPQPIFATRKVTTTIVIWDGQTVVMGGLIRESLTKIKDKIPFLGDLPLIGRLFRTEGEFSQKKNLVIFVTARLVDPSGKPIHKAETGVSETVPTATKAGPTPPTT